MNLSQPKSWIGFLAGAGLGFLLFLPIALLGLAHERIPWFLAGLTGAAFAWIAAAFMGIRLATGIRQGRYRDLRPASWREQVW